MDPTTFRARLATDAARVEAVLEARLPTPPKSGACHQARVMEAMRYSALAGGKRLRPFLVIEAARLFGVTNDAPVVAGAALECVHAYSLVHDDLPCMDDDDLRRGKPTVHVVWDEAIGVLAGDGLLTFAFELMSGVDASAEVRLALMRELAVASGTLGMIGGQVVDMTVEEGERDLDLITSLQDMKTGALIRFGARAGAMIGGASAEETAHLDGYAKALGLLFQITDDLLDVEGTLEAVGKAVGKDAGLGKATFVSSLGLAGAKERARQMRDVAIAHLDGFGPEGDVLRACVDFVLNRDR